MPYLRTTHEPQNGAHVLAQALTSLYRPDAGASPLHHLNPGETTFGAHHAVYELDLDTLAGAGGVEHARRHGSRYLLSKNGQVQAAIEFDTDADGKEATAFRSLNVGPFVEATEQAIRRAEAHPGTKPSEFAVLRAAALRLWILWLRPVDGAAPSFWIMEPAPEGLDVTRPYDERELFAAMQTLAKACLQPGNPGDPDDMAG